MDHLSKKDFETVYEPGEDTYLFMDTLKSEKDFIFKKNPTLCLEIGGGSGCLTKSFASLFKSRETTCSAEAKRTMMSPMFFITDIGEHAINCCSRATRESGFAYEVLRMDLLKAFVPTEAIGFFYLPVSVFYFFIYSSVFKIKSTSCS